MNNSSVRELQGDDDTDADNLSVHSSSSKGDHGKHERMLNIHEFKQIYKKNISKYHVEPADSRRSAGGRSKNGNMSSVSSRLFTALNAPMPRYGAARQESKKKRTSNVMTHNDIVTSAPGNASGEGVQIVSYIEGFKETAQEGRLRKRHIPNRVTDACDPEILYMENIQLKTKSTQLISQLQLQRTQFNKVLKEKEDLEKKIDDLLQSSVAGDATSALKAETKLQESAIVRSLRTKVRSMESKLITTTEDLNRLKLDGKYLRVRELEAEVKAYYSEARRLSIILEQMMKSKPPEAESTAMDNMLALLHERGQVIIRLNEKINDMKSQQRATREEQDTHEKRVQQAISKMDELHRRSNDDKSLLERCERDLREAKIQLSEEASRKEHFEREFRRSEDLYLKYKTDFDRLCKDYEKVQNDLDRMQANTNQLQNQHAYAKADLHQAKEQLTKAEARIEELTRMTRSKESDLSDLGAKLKVAERERDVARGRCDDLGKDFAASKADASSSVLRIASLSQELAEKSEILNQLRDKLQATDRAHQDQLRLIEDQKRAQIDVAQSQMKADLERRQLAFDETNRAIDEERTGELRVYKDRCATLVAELTETRKQLEISRRSESATSSAPNDSKFPDLEELCERQRARISSLEKEAESYRKSTSAPSTSTREVQELRELCERQRARLTELERIRPATEDNSLSAKHSEILASPIITPKAPPYETRSAVNRDRSTASVASYKSDTKKDLSYASDNPHVPSGNRSRSRSQDSTDLPTEDIDKYLTGSDSDR